MSSRGLFENFRELEKKHWHQSKGHMELDVATSIHGNNHVASQREPGLPTKGDDEMSCVLAKGPNPHPSPPPPVLRP